MLYVLGLGYSVPKTSIDRSVIEKVNPTFPIGDFERDVGILTRTSALPMQTIEDSHTLTPRDAFSTITCTHIDMAHQSAVDALAQAKVSQEQIGLIIGDCASPVETCPSEAQRLGARLGLKIPAYDVIASAGAFVVHCATVNRWREDRCPEYILCTTSGTITHTIDYAQGIAGALFGDGAASYILSTSHKGKLAVIDAGFTIDAKQARDLRVETYGRCRIPESYVTEFIRPSVTTTLQKLKTQYGFAFSTARFIGAQSDVEGSARAAQAVGFQRERILSNGQRFGDILGASIPAVLADAWSTLQKGEKIFVVQAGLGIASGYVVFEVMQ